ncbi:MAG: rod shape-determining protein MreD, partial [Prevotella sp.]
LLYIYFILLFRRNYPRWAIILWSFFTGLCIDIFSNTPGVAASATTIIGLLQPYLLNLFIPRDSPEDLMPSVKSLGFLKYLYYSFICVSIYTTLFFSIETFNFFNWIQWLKNIAGSTIITLLLIIAIENTKKK